MKRVLAAVVLMVGLDYDQTATEEKWQPYCAAKPEIIEVQVF
jgi:hypothetical protein